MLEGFNDTSMASFGTPGMAKRKRKASFFSQISSFPKPMTGQMRFTPGPWTLSGEKGICTISLVFSVCRSSLFTLPGFESVPPCKSEPWGGNALLGVPLGVEIAGEANGFLPKARMKGGGASPVMAATALGL